MKKLQNAMIQIFLRARAEMLALENQEDGLETVETVILVGVAVILAIIVYKALTGGDQEGNSGLLGSLFDAIEDKINEIFGTDKVKRGG